jgi:UDP-glucose 4-epimerase
VKVLVTGGAGFIGSHVVDAYLEAGHEVLVVDDLSTGSRANINPAASFYEMDIRESRLADVFEKERPDCVNHLAAQVDVRRSLAEPLFDADVNILGSVNLLECVRKYPVKRLIYVSTGGAVYGEPEYLPCDESHPIRPVCQYGASKFIVEKYLYMYQLNHGVNYAVVRYPNVYGPRQDPHGEAGVVAIFAGRMLTGEEVIIHGDGEQQRDFVFVGDCVRANLLITEADSGGTYNIGSGRGTSVNELFWVLKDITGYGQMPVHGPPKLGETRTIYLSAEKARSELGWRQTKSLRQGLEATVNFLRRKAADETPDT